MPEFGLRSIDATGSITDQQRAVRRLVSEHLEATDEQREPGGAGA